MVRWASGPVRDTATTLPHVGRGYSEGSPTPDVDDRRAISSITSERDRDERYCTVTNVIETSLQHVTECTTYVAWASDDDAERNLNGPASVQTHQGLFDFLRHVSSWNI
jgi:hypothetical protein